jgi:hypothetical protein
VENKALTPNLSPKKGRGGFIWYPFLFAAFPVLYLLASNIGQARPVAGMRPLLVAIAGAAVLMGLVRPLLRDWVRAAFVATAWLLLFAMYGHVFGYLLKIGSPLAESLANMNFLGGVALLLAASALFAASRPKVRLEAWVGPLNAVGLVLVVFSVVQIAWYQIEVLNAPSVGASASPVEFDGPKPDIYYIVLDMYTRADTLQSAYGYDNSEFISGLEGMGFNVAECAMSNYTRTELSLASSLNMAYLTSELDARIQPDSQARSPMWNLIRNNAAMDYVERRGYKTVTFATGFPWLELDNASVYLEPDPIQIGMTEFESLLLGTTAFRIADEKGWVNVEAIGFSRYRERTQFVLDTLPTLAKMDGPKFVYAHILLPHPPFVFAEDGGKTDPTSYLNENDVYPADKFAAGYTMQVTFANREITRIVQEIIAQSRIPPIIIIQGDHGPWLQPTNRHMTILNAYYLPGHADAVDEFITPVNTFRTVFNLYLGGKFDLLPNVSYYSPVPNQYDFSTVVNTCKPK